MRIPLAPAAYSQPEINQILRAIELALSDATRVAQVGYQIGAHSGVRAFDSGTAASCVGSIGAVTVTATGGTNATVAVTGVGGAQSAPSTQLIADTLATFLDDAKQRGIIG